jgi:glycosyltransferase involved in cell wall biosynthesis
MEKINVLLLLYSIKPAGAEKVVLSLAKCIDKSKYNPVVCALKGGELLNDFIKLNIPVYVLNKKTGFDLSVIWKLYRIIKKEKINIIHSHNFSPNFWGRLIGYITGVHVLIITEHTIATTKSRVQKLIDRLLSGITDKIIAVSHRVRDSHIEQEKISPEKIITIYNGIEGLNIDDDNMLTFKNEFKKWANIPHTHYLITTIGRLESPKGHINLFKAIPLVINRYPQTTFLIVGDGSLRNQLEDLVQRLNIKENIVFTGFRSDISDILYISDLCVVPSYREGFSITVLEAMSVGKPVVATDVGGNAEAVVNGKSGIIVKPQDHMLLADAIIKVISDTNMRQRMGAYGKERYQHYFTLQKMKEETENIYNDLWSTHCLQ